MYGVQGRRATGGQKWVEPEMGGVRSGWSHKWVEPAFPRLQGKVQKCWVHWKPGLTERLRALSRPHHPPSSRGGTTGSCPSSKQDQLPPQLHPASASSLCLSPNLLGRQGGHSSGTTGACSTAAPLILKFSSSWDGESAESQVSDLGEEV